MNKNKFSPYLRVAMFSTIKAPFKISNRVIFDYEIILVASGKCKITIDNTEYLCKKNDVVFIRPGIQHNFECVGDCDFVQPHIHFDVSYNDKSEETVVSFKPKKNMTEYERSLIQEDVFKDIFIPYVFTPYDVNKFQKIFFEIIEIFQNKSYNYELLYKSKMLELFDCVLTQFDKNAANTHEIHNPVIMAKNYIDNNYLSVITLDLLSERFCINKFTLMRKFSKMYGQSIMSYYRSKRIEYIEEILKTTTIPIKVLFERMNFSDVYSFSRFFKSFTGYSPEKYRKNHSVDKDSASSSD